MKIMNNVNKPLILLVMVFLLACSTGKEHQAEEGNVIEVDVKDIQTLKYTDVFQLKDIVLFDSPDIIVSNIDKATLFREYVIVKCSGSVNSLISKNITTGESIKIGREGRGPGEYLKLADFLIDEEKAEIWILDRSLGKILKYDLEGELQSEDIKNIYLHAQAFYKLADDKVALYYGSNGSHRVQIVNTTTGEVLERHIEVKENEAQFLHFFEASNFTDGGLFHFKFHNNLYEMNGFKKAYEISFKNQTLPAEIMERNFEDVREFVEYCRATSYAYGVSNIIEMPHQMLFAFNYDKGLANCIYDLDSNKYKVYNEISNDVFGLGQVNKLGYMDLPRGGNMNTLMFEVEPQIAKEQLEKARRTLPKDQWEALYSNRGEWIGLLDSLSLESNSFLVLVELKDEVRL